MRKVGLVLGVLLIIIVIGALVYYPNIEFYKDGFLYMTSYASNDYDSEDLNVVEGDSCYDESYYYDKKRDITIKNYEYKGVLFFKYFKFNYVKGNLCDSEYLLEESYITRVINEATIIENLDNVDLAKLIEHKKAVVSNTKYPFPDNYHYISYILDEEEKEMYVSYNEEGFLIIQIGNSDEGPKYIVYK